MEYKNNGIILPYQNLRKAMVHSGKAWFTIQDEWAALGFDRAVLIDLMNGKESWTMEHQTAMCTILGATSEERMYLFKK